MSTNSSPTAAGYSVLNKDLTVKDLEIKKEKPSIFIGSSTESLAIVKYIKKQFDPEVFDVNGWEDGVFGLIDESNPNISWLKNFTDIYDFAIFLFVPDDKIISTRTNTDGNALEGFATRHNVIFEFGLFLGRIGANKTYILLDKEMAGFIENFFTDLKGDSKVIKRHYFNGNDKEWLNNTGENSHASFSSLAGEVLKIKEDISKNRDKFEIGFLPSTALAIGYFNNFIKIVVDNIKDIRQPEMPKAIVTKCERDPELKRSVELIRRKKNIQIEILIPERLDKAKHEEFKKDYLEAKLDDICIPGITRNMTAYKCPESASESNDDLIIYDVPSTINSSIDSIDLINEALQIKQLLSIKEIRNFTKSITYLIKKHNVEDIVKVRMLEDFRKNLMKQS